MGAVGYIPGPLPEIRLLYVEFYAHDDHGQFHAARIFLVLLWTRRTTTILLTIRFVMFYLLWVHTARQAQSISTKTTPISNHLRRGTSCQTTSRGMHFGTPRANLKSNGFAIPRPIGKYLF